MDYQPAPASISPLELNQRQLSAWQALKQQLLAANAEDPQLDYCEQRIASFEAEIAQLSI